MLAMKKAIFMGTPEFAVASLETLYESSFEIAMVITQPDRKKDRGKKMQSPPVKEKALEWGLEVYQPDSIKTEEAIEKIRATKPDVIIVTAYGQILPKAILQIPSMGCINVHASLLPRYRGAAPINYVLINGEKKTGITTMYMSGGLDTGDIILSDEIDISDEWNSQILHDELAALSKITLRRTLEALIEGRAPRIPQDESAASYAKMMKKSLGHIHWDQEGKTIRNLVRGTVPWPGAYSLYKGQIMKIFEVRPTDECSENLPGTIVRISKEGLYVSAKDRLVCIHEIQMSGKRKMSVSEYLKGNSIEVGEILS